MIDRSHGRSVAVRTEMTRDVNLAFIAADATAPTPDLDGDKEADAAVKATWRPQGWEAGPRRVSVRREGSGRSVTKKADLKPTHYPCPRDVRETLQVAPNRCEPLLDQTAGQRPFPGIAAGQPHPLNTPPPTGRLTVTPSGLVSR